MKSVRSILMSFLALSALAGCSKTTVPVSVHGVNYSGEDFSYVIVDAGGKNAAGGETIGPYAAGGIMCCYDLPTKWREGIQITLKTRYWKTSGPDEEALEFSETRTLEVPAYANGKPGEIWVLRLADGQLDIVSSDFQPDHARWPGKIKGWPVSSLAYQRERIDLYIRQEEGAVSLYQGLLRDLKKDPVALAREFWATSKKYHPKSIAGFTGPEDRSYHASLLKEFEDGYVRAQKNIKELKAHRP